MSHWSGLRPLASATLGISCCCPVSWRFYSFGFESLCALQQFIDGVDLGLGLTIQKTIHCLNIHAAISLKGALCRGHGALHNVWVPALNNFVILYNINTGTCYHMLYGTHGYKELHMHCFNHSTLKETE